MRVVITLVWRIRLCSFVSKLFIFSIKIIVKNPRLTRGFFVSFLDDLAFVHMNFGL